MTRPGRRVFDMGRAMIDAGIIPAPVERPVSGTIMGFPYTLVPESVMNTQRQIVFGTLREPPLFSRPIREIVEVPWVRQAMRDSMDRYRNEQEEMRQRELAARKKEMEMTAVKNVIQLETGEKREGMTASSRVFFVYVTPTGAEMPIARCPSIKKEWSRTTGGFEGASRSTITEYEVKAPTTLKMVNLQSTFGRPKRVVNLTLDINPDEATIDLQGLQEFGRFKGRAKVNLKSSTYYVNREGFTLTDTVLKEHFGLKVLQPPTKTGAGRRPRSLIFE